MPLDWKSKSKSGHRKVLAFRPKGEITQETPLLVLPIFVEYIGCDFSLRSR
jgi:hypothetical protein